MSKSGEYAADAGRRILVIEDDAGLNRLLCRGLERAGYATEAAHTGREAIDRALSEQYALLLLDFHLPDMTGREIVGRLREHGDMAPFVTMTGLGDATTAVDMMKLGSMDYVVKDAGFIKEIAGVAARALEDADVRRRLAQTQAALETNEARFRAMWDTADIGLLLVDATEHGILDANPAACKLFERTLAEIRGRECHRFICPHEKGHCPISDRGQRIDRAEREVIRADGSLTPVLKTVTPLTLDGREVYLESFVDISERRQAELQNQEARERLHLAMESAGQGIWEWDYDAGVVRFDATALRMLGFEPDFPPRAGEWWVQRIHPGDRTLVITTYEAFIAGKVRRYTMEFRLRGRNGEYVWIASTARIIRADPAGRPLLVVGTHQDITPRKTIEHSLKRALTESRQHETETKALLDAAQAVLECHEFMLAARRIFDACRSATGATAGYVALLSADGRNNDVLFLEAGNEECRVDPALPMPIRGLRAEAYRSKKAAYHNDFMHSEWRRFMPAGHMSLRNVLFAPLVIDGVTVGVMGLANKEGDFSADDARMSEAFGDLAAVALRRARSDEELRESKRMLDATGAMGKIGGWSHDFATGKAIWTQALYDILALAPEAEPPGVTEHLSWYPPADAGLLEQAYRRAASEGRAFDLELRVYTAEKQQIWCRVQGERIRDERGACTGMRGTFQDITDRKQLEERLRQAQKLEAIGQLAGGVAHDFNNILGGISGYADLLRLKYSDVDEAHRKYVNRISSAAHKASGLTRQLLAFARQSAIEARPVDMHDCVNETVAMLSHTIDRRIEIRTDLSAREHICLADKSQIENALLNLAVNARDAMPDGGVLTFATRNRPVEDGRAFYGEELERGDYVSVIVRDTGGGMSEETAKRAFDPFFTTKAQGKGTGLGLSSVYGILRQHRGAIGLRSEPGAGTEFELLLPILESNHDETCEDAEATLVRGAGAVLVVEDDEAMRDACADMVTGLGYTVQTCHDGEEGVRRYREKWREIDLVLLDLIMPRLNGVACMRAMKEVNPAVRVVVTTGYGEDARREDMTKLGALAFIDKPFEIAKLAAVIDRVINTHSEKGEL
jgi:PAS domain S-box-containing protein